MQFQVEAIIEYILEISQALAGVVPLRPTQSDQVLGIGFKEFQKASSL